MFLLHQFIPPFFFPVIASVKSVSCDESEAVEFPDNEQKKIQGFGFFFRYTSSLGGMFFIML